MAGLLGTLQSARTGMSVSQTSIQTTSHNLNNLNTPGYSRQRVQQSARSAYSYPGYNSSLGAGQLGTGVEATDISRIRNTFYDFQFRNESHTQGSIEVKYEHYTTMESIFNEPSETGISSSINNFFSSWQELSKNPKDAGSKDIVIQNSEYLANNISNVYNKLDNLKSNANKKLEKDIKEVNQMLNQLKDLNKHIKIVKGSGKSPNDLMDQRDNILDELSFKMNIEVEDGSIKIKDTDGKLTEINDVDRFSVEYDSSQKPIVKYGENTLKNISGQIQGSVEMVDKIDKYKEDLKNFAKGITNTVNNSLKDEDGNKLELFIFNDVEKPMIKVNNEMLDGKKLNISSETAQKMYKLKDEKLELVSGEDNITVNNLYNNIIQNLGNETQEIIRNEKNQSKILKDIDNSRANISGVTLDEEMVNLVQFQHAYNASAKVISTINSLLDVVVNGLVR